MGTLEASYGSTRSISFRLAPGSDRAEGPGKVGATAHFTSQALGSHRPEFQPNESHSHGQHGPGPVSAYPYMPTALSMRMATSDMSLRATPMVLRRQLPVAHVYVDSICPSADGLSPSAYLLFPVVVIGALDDNRWVWRGKHEERKAKGHGKRLSVPCGVEPSLQTAGIWRPQSEKSASPGELSGRASPF
jgi:hypothetical protein